jgi:hypothetical protein
MEGKKGKQNLALWRGGETPTRVGGLVKKKNFEIE